GEPNHEDGRTPDRQSIRSATGSRSTGLVGRQKTLRRRPDSSGLQSQGAFVQLLLQFFLDLLHFLVEGLIEEAGFLAPGLALGVRLSGVGDDFPAVNILIT